jgi:hypothetical protein
MPQPRPRDSSRPLSGCSGAPAASCRWTSRWSGSVRRSTAPRRSTSPVRVPALLESLCTQRGRLRLEAILRRGPRSRRRDTPRLSEAFHDREEGQTGEGCERGFMPKATRRRSREVRIGFASPPASPQMAGGACSSCSWKTGVGCAPSSSRAAAKRRGSFRALRAPRPGTAHGGARAPGARAGRDCTGARETRKR